MLTSKDYRVQETRLNDVQRKAAQQAELDAIRSTDDEQPAYAGTLANVGKVMVEIGSRLQDRYGALADDAPPTTANTWA